MPTLQQLQHQHESAGLVAQFHQQNYQAEFDRIVAIVKAGGDLPDLTALTRMAAQRDHYGLVAEIMTQAYVK